MSITPFIRGMRVKRSLILVLLFMAMITALYFFYPFLFAQVSAWQKVFNQSISQSLREISQSPTQAGGTLVLISFLYGVFHALGPGHGKFIIASYLATQRTKLQTSMRLTLLSSLVQGVVAILLVSLLVVAFTLSTRYFKLTQLWVERASYLLIILIGSYWLVRYLSPFFKRFTSQKNKPIVIKKIIAESGISGQLDGIYGVGKSQSAVKKYINITALSPQNTHQQCSCGHQHTPNTQQLTQITDWKSQLMVILSIGMRPCTGAIFVLFLAYMLDLYWWGVLATMVMAIGTGLTLSCFALLVLYARRQAEQLGRWYLSPALSQKVALSIKIVWAILLILLGVSLFHASFLNVGGASLFGR